MSYLNVWRNTMAKTDNSSQERKKWLCALFALRRVCLFVPVLQRTAYNELIRFCFSIGALIYIYTERISTKKNKTEDKIKNS